MPELALKTTSLTKTYRLYASPKDRLREALHPLRRKYGTDFTALDNVSLTVNRGETLGIIGVNGSGKSTLLKLITGTTTPSLGNVEVYGTVAALLELGAGFNPELSGYENIFFAGTIMGFSRKEMEAMVDAIIAFADIGEFINHPMKTYSSGMYARLAFAVNTCISPDIFIVDEALAVGDTAFVHRCMLRFRDMQRSGKTILLVTHDITATKQLCDKVLWLEKGKVKMHGEAKAVCDAYLADMTHCPPALDGTPGVCNATDKASAQGLRETVIPHIDNRIGNQKCSIVGVGLYDTKMQPITSAPNNSHVILRMTVRNNALEDHNPLVVGYLVKNRSSVELASSDNTCEVTDLGAFGNDNLATVEIKIYLPALYPSSYSISPSCGYTADSGEHIMTDFISNAIHLEITSESKVHIQMRFDSSYTRVG